MLAARSLRMDRVYRSSQVTQRIDWEVCDAHVVAIDFGVKSNILRRGCGFKVTVVQ